MKIMKIAGLLTIAALLGITTAGWSQEIVASIDLKDVPLEASIETLARQMNINFMLDPKLSEPTRDADGKILPQPKVTYRWENKSADEALAQLIKEHGVKMVKSSASSVTRFMFTNQPAIKVDGNLVGNDTNAIPLMQMDSAPIAEALTTLAKRANINITPDQKLSRSQLEVSFRWKNITAKQALIALCENFELVLIKDSSTGAIQIKPNEK